MRYELHNNEWGVITRTRKRRLWSGELGARFTGELSSPDWEDVVEL